MPLNGTLNRILSEPNNREIDLLEGDMPEEDENLATFNRQTSFLEATDPTAEAKVIRVSTNTNQKLIVVTQDKTLLCLKKNLAKIGRREWIAPLSTVMTILIALITSDFRSALWLSRAEWKAIFIVCGFIATGWLVHSIRKALNAKGFHDVITDIVYELGAQKRNAPERLA